MIGPMIELNKNFSTTRCVQKMDADLVIAEINAAHKPEDKFKTVLFLPEGEGRQGEGGLRTQGYFKKSEENKPLITVVTVVYNGEQFLEETILSVINQSYDNVEYIIIDGGSTDGTLDIIREYEHAIDYWVSEKDKGIYDAMNKGVEKATGYYIGLINADDWYELDTVQSIVNQINNKNSIDVFYADMNIVDIDTKAKKLLIGDIERLNKNMSLNHPTCFLKRELYKEKTFDSRYKIAADYDLMLYFKFNKKSFFHINKIFANMRSGGVSCNNNKTVEERFLIHKKYYSKIYAYVFLWEFKVKVFIRDFLGVLLPLKLVNRLKGYK